MSSTLYKSALRRLTRFFVIAVMTVSFALSSLIAVLWATSFDQFPSTIGEVFGRCVPACKYPHRLHYLPSRGTIETANEKVSIAICYCSLSDSGLLFFSRITGVGIPSQLDPSHAEFESYYSSFTMLALMPKGHPEPGLRQFQFERLIKYCDWFPTSDKFPYTTVKSVVVPHWLAIVVVGGPVWIGSIPFVRSIRARGRARRGLCPKCAYNLANNVSGTCPECGTKVPTPR